MKKDNTYIYKLYNNLYINLTNKCCNDCDFCLRRNSDGILGGTLWLEKEPSASEVIDLIKQVSFEYNEAVFCGYGESTYKLKELIEVANHLKSIEKRVRLNTNGLGNIINNCDIVPSLKGKIDIVSVSLNESDANRYNKICKPKYGLEAFGYILDFAKKCIDARIETIMTVVDIIGSVEIEKCRKICDEIGAVLKVRKLISDNENYI